MLLFGNATMKFLISLTMSCIETAIADHFEMLFRDMLDEAFNEFQCRNGFFNVLIVFMAVVMKSDVFAIIFVYP